jgi:hypothetical protein
MAAVGRRGQTALARAGLAASALALGLAPLVVAMPAQAADPTPPVAVEPPGGATCDPQQPPGDCQQEAGSSATPAPVASATSTGQAHHSSTTGSGGSARSTSARTTADLPSTLAHTGGGPAIGWGGAAGVALGAGAVLLAVGRRRAPGRA